MPRFDAYESAELIWRQMNLGFFNSEKITDPLQIKRCRKAVSSKVFIKLTTINAKFPTDFCDGSVVTTKQF